MPFPDFFMSADFLLVPVNGEGDLTAALASSNEKIKMTGDMSVRPSILRRRVF